MGKRFPAYRYGEPGVCRLCGCSDFDACATGCGWIDSKQTLCSSCGDLARFESKAMRDARSGTRYRASVGFATVFHRGFLAGFWLGSRGHRNPYLAPTVSALWLRGYEAGRLARREFPDQLAIEHARRLILDFAVRRVAA